MTTPSTYYFDFCIHFDSYHTDTMQSRRIRHFMTTDDMIERYPYRVLIELIFGKGTRIMSIKAEKQDLDKPKRNKGTSLLKVDWDDRLRFFEDYDYDHVYRIEDRTDTDFLKGCYIVSNEDRLIGKVLSVESGASHWDAYKSAPLRLTT